jgi:hypothetical protein
MLFIRIVLAQVAVSTVASQTDYEQVKILLLL